jgi:hypothetical protein
MEGEGIAGHFGIEDRGHGREKRMALRLGGNR